MSVISQLLDKLIPTARSDFGRGMLKSAESVIGNTPSLKTLGTAEERLVTQAMEEGVGAQQKTLFGIAQERTQRQATLMRARALGHQPFQDENMQYLMGGSIADKVNNAWTAEFMHPGTHMPDYGVLKDPLVGEGQALTHLRQLDAGVPIPEGHQRLYRGEGVRSTSRGAHQGEEHLAGAWYTPNIRTGYGYASGQSMIASHGGGTVGEELLQGFGHVRYVDLPNDVYQASMVRGGHIQEHLLPPHIMERSRLVGQAGPSGPTPELGPKLLDPKGGGGFQINSERRAIDVPEAHARILNNVAESMDLRAAKFENAQSTNHARAYGGRRHAQSKAERVAKGRARAIEMSRRPSSARTGLRMKGSGPDTAAIANRTSLF